MSPPQSEFVNVLVESLSVATSLRYIFVPELTKRGACLRGVLMQ